ncbi:50S ribosomal protein L6 [Candidatus Woesearchaeota archaeon]|nr:50S ribosomal protein L6 [Candidatus Woesearchaeota archaeon]
MKEDIHEELSIPDGVTVTFAERKLTVKGPKGEVSREILSPSIQVAIADGAVQFSVEKATKRENRLLLTYLSHAKNMIKGVEQPWTYTLKICSSHFPMNVKLSGQEFSVKKFLGEDTPRKCTLPTDAKVSVNGSDITVESCDIEAAGNVASRLELLTRIRDRDLRIFQDGIYITKKAKQK